MGLSEGPIGDEELILGLAVGVANPVICVLRLAMDVRHGGAAVAHPGMGGFELEDFIYLIGPFAWLGGIEYFFLIYGLGTFGYLVFTIGSFFRQEYFKQKFGQSGH